MLNNKEIDIKKNDKNYKWLVLTDPFNCPYTCTCQNVFLAKVGFFGIINERERWPIFYWMPENCLNN